jgi:hypothetical protein
VSGEPSHLVFQPADAIAGGYKVDVMGDAIAEIGLARL